MQLYLYDHCPYCVRARMIFGKKMVPVENIYLLNDDEDTPNKLIGKKMVPILVKDDGSAMGESLDIVHYIDQLTGGAPLNTIIRPEIEGWIKITDTYRNFLTLPRCISIKLPEFATQSAIDYFISKKTTIFGDFQQHLRNSQIYIDRLNADLIALSPLILSDRGVNGTFSMEDILLFPLLRNLTMVKGVEWTAPVIDYMNSISRITQIPLFDDRTI
ncbi:glutaredoxin, GrxB family [Snodgrassella alvi]|jgi:glutaredoxin 2|uniref:glutaredoxin 2 n=1 Tax=Snodgrassella alvi TaxID=1196083 RepID=UPI000C1E665E|nr:glutaredoxin 2 [Snodgrassella alvi]PIT06731.1 glutaredoxin, GrxB family [Snodgrassella alvi]PIT57497.1 glutaredoxin, GrxB family [Snodgrassella alvi]